MQYGDDHVKEVEELWGALCRWRKNIHITINFLIHIARVSSSSALLQHVKKIIVCFVRTQQIEIIEEVIDQLKVHTSHLLKSLLNTFLCIYIMYNTLLFSLIMIWPKYIRTYCR